MSEQPPLTPGTTTPERVEAPRPLQPIIARPKSLVSLAADHEFLFHWLLPVMQLGDPVPNYYAEAGVSTKLVPKMLTLDQPFVQGNLPEFCLKTVFAVPKEAWEGLAAYLGTISFLARDRRIYFDAVRQVLPLTDFLGLSNSVAPSGPAPMVHANFIALEGVPWCYHFAPPLDPFGKIILKKDLPSPETVRLAEAIFARDSDPFTGEGGLRIA